MSDLVTLGPWLRRFLCEHIVTERNLARNGRRVARRHAFIADLVLGNRRGINPAQKMTRGFKAGAGRRSDPPQQDRLEKAGAGLTRGIEAAEGFRGLVGRRERQPHHETLPVEQGRRKPVLGARMSDNADSLQQTALLKHRPRASNDAPHDGIVALGKAYELPQEIIPNVGAEFVKARAKDILGAQASVIAHIPEDRVLRGRRQRIAE